MGVKKKRCRGAPHAGIAHGKKDHCKLKIVNWKLKNDELRKPPWLKKRIPPFQDLQKVKSILAETDLHTVCEEARCPNLGECFTEGTATILILGRICTRNCGFCAVENGLPAPLNGAEPEHVAQAVKRMGLRYVVITSVTRDDLPDGGASHFARTIQAIRTTDQRIKIEVLVPDFKGDMDSLAVVLRERPDVLNHNIETIPRLYPAANHHRPRGVVAASANGGDASLRPQSG